MEAASDTSAETFPVSPQRATHSRSYAGALGLCAATTLMALPFYAAIDLSNVILLYVLAVAASAALWGRGPAVLASFVGVVCFNFFFVPPRFSLTVADPQYLLTFAVMLVVSLLIGYLSNAYREKAEEAERRAGEAALLHELAQTLAGALSNEHVADLLGVFVKRRFAAGAGLFLPDAQERLQPVGEGRHVDYIEHAAVQGVYAGRKPTGAIGDLHPDACTVLLPLLSGTRCRGVLTIYVNANARPPEPNLLDAIAALVATAVERIHYVEVAQATELEAQSVRLRSSILSAISHDIRTPLTVLFGLADAIAAGDTSRETAVAMRDQSYRLHRMVDNLLDMARLKSGKVTLRRDWQSVPEIVAASAQMLGSALQGHSLTFAWPADLPLFRVDALLMERVFGNLLENAAKYSPPSTPIVIGADLHGETASVWIANEGKGFPPERIDHIFDLFERGEAESATPGVGVGLSICRTIVEAHGGRIQAENQPGGARVRIDLPLERMPPMPEESGHD